MQLLKIFLVILILFPLAGRASARGDEEPFFVAAKNGIYSGHLDKKSGSITPLHLDQKLTGAGFLALDPSRKFLYSVNTIKNAGKTEGVTSAFSIHPKTGELTFLNHQSTLGGPTHLSVDRTGKCVLVASYGGGSISVFPIKKDGALDSVSAFVQHSGASLNLKRQSAPHVHCITMDPENRFAISCDLGLDKVFAYRLDAGKGTLATNSSAFATLKAGTGPRHHAFHPDGHFLYVINELDSSITAFTYDGRNGFMREFQTVSTVSKDFVGTNYPAEIAVHPTGKFLYGSNRGEDSIVVCRINQKNGEIAVLGRDSTGGKNPRHFQIDPSGNYLLVANQDSGNVVVFRINLATGRLVPTGNVFQIEGPQCIKFLRGN